MWWRRRKALEDLQQDIRDHLDQETADNTARGMSPDEARRRAHVKFGNSTLAVEGTREVWVWRWLEQLRQDVRYGLRLLVRDRAFSTVAVLTLAVGMGVSTALFSVIDAALLRPLPYPNPEQLVEISVQTRRADGRMSGGGAPSLLDVRAWRDAQHAVSHVGMGRLTGRPLIVEAGGEPERLRVATVTEDVFELFGVNPILGRGIHPGDTHEGAPAVAVLGHGYWQTRFGGTPGVLGRTIRIANLPAIVVGILPEGFYSDTMIWQAQQFPATWERRRGTGTPVYGRLLAGLTFEDAQRRLSDVIRASAGDDAESATASVQLESLYNAETAGYGSTMKILYLAVSIILVVACVNVAGLLLARGALRQSEMAVRASIGAGRLRLTRQLLAESLVLSCVGGGLGVALAWISLDALVALLPLSLPPNAPVAVNGTVLACAAGLSAGTALVVGLVPALRLSKVRIGEHLGAAGRRHGSALSRRGGQLLIAVEVALGVVLLASAGLLLRSFDRLMEVDLGIDPDSFVTMEVEPVDPAPTVRKQFYSALLEAIGALPDVAAVGAIDSLPLGGGFMRVTRATAGELDSGPANLRVLQVMPGYFEAVGLEASMGRLPTEADLTSAEHVAVINEQAERQFFSERSPVGLLLRTPGNDPPRRIIGVVQNVWHSGPQFPLWSEAFSVYGHVEPEPLTIVVRPYPGRGVSNDQLRRLARAVGPAVLLGQIRHGSDWLDDRVATPRQRTAILSLLGGFGLILTLVGIFSMTAYAVARRTRDIGVSVALGAQPIDVVGRMVGEAMWPVVVGLMLGLGGAYYASRVVERFLFETRPHDPVTFAAVALVMGATALVAAWIPARRAATVDPILALRAE